MTEWRNELLKDIINAMYKVENMQCSKLLVMARAALAVAEPVIREQADIALRAELAAVTERMSKLDFERTAAELERDALREENARLRKALIDILASLVASVDLLERGGKKAAPSDKMFAQMLVDYKNSIEQEREELILEMAEELIEKMARAMCIGSDNWTKFIAEARAALAAAEPVIREQCAQICERRYMGDNTREDMEAKRCAAAVREGGEDRYARG